MEKREMKDNNKRDMLLVLYIITVLALAVMYFSVPERKDFLDFQSQWWGEMWQVIKGGV